MIMIMPKDGVLIINQFDMASVSETYQFRTEVNIFWKLTYFTLKKCYNQICSFGSLPETATKVRAAITARAMFWILERKPQSSSQTNNSSVGARESESALTGFATLSN